MIRERLCSKKVLIVFDNLDKKKQLEKLAGKWSWFGPESRVIVTTRDLSVLMAEVEASNDEILNETKRVFAYEVHEMEFDRALKLFCKHAFRRDSPLEDYDDLSIKIVSTVGKLPLALEVISSFLCCNRKVLWEDTLRKLKKVPPKEVQETLMISYNGLDYEQKRVFSDIACFFIKEDKEYPVFMWDHCGYFPHDAIRVLCLRSLIKIGDKNKFWMHDQVRDLGRHIIRVENLKNPGKRIRVCDDEEALDILENKEVNYGVNSIGEHSFNSFLWFRFYKSKENLTFGF